MRLRQLKFGRGFQIVIGNRHSQAAQMTLQPGEVEGGSGNRHRGADQWLFVVSGRGEAVINKRRKKLRKGTLLLIGRGDEHEIRNTGRSPMRTFNLYVPPAYTADGDELPAGRANK